MEQNAQYQQLIDQLSELGYDYETDDSGEVVSVYPDCTITAQAGKNLAM